MKAETKPPVAIIAAAVLLWLVLISAHFTTGMFARYITETEGSDSSRIASFAVSAEADEATPVSIIADGTDANGIAAYTVRVKNNGETAVSYEAEVIFEAQEDEDKFKSDGGKLTFSGILAPNSEADKYITLDMSSYFDTDSKYSTLSNDDISGGKGILPFTVIVTFTQID